MFTLLDCPIPSGGKDYQYKQSSPTFHISQRINSSKTNLISYDVHDDIIMKDDDVASQIDTKKEETTSEDRMTVFTLLIKSMCLKHSYLKTSNRGDVICKTIFRVYRQFFKSKLAPLLPPRPDLIEAFAAFDILTEIVAEYVGPIKDREEIANYIGALIMPKFFRNIKVSKHIENV